MKNYFLILFVLTSIASFSQTDYSKIKMEKDADFKPADKYALEASNYLFSIPFDKSNPQRQSAQQFVINWMQGTPDYSFNVDATVMEKIVGENSSDILGLYMVSMAKYVLENPANANDFELVKVNAAKILAAYAEKSENKVPVSKPLAKLIEANKKGQIEKALK